jgi:hypothetical protein
LLVLDILKTEKSRVRDRFISYSKYSRRGTLFQKYLSEAKLNNVDKQTNGLMGFEPPSRTIHSITRQCQCDHDYCAPAFSQVNLLLRVVMG